jgi:uncharacterized NAD-dependent epimerase/dehydratase family protein
VTRLLEGNAIVYCQGMYGTTNGKTAHGLVRRTLRYRVLSVVDARHAGQDAHELLDGRTGGIPVYPDITSAFEATVHHAGEQQQATHLVVGLAPDGGRLPVEARWEIAKALGLGLSVDSGLHDFLSEDPELMELAERSGAIIRDIRKPPDRSRLHFFTGKIEQVDSLKIAVLGTDSAVGKRTTAWMLVDALQAANCTAELVGTGQTAWLQGARYCIVLDALVNDFVAGEIEHAIWSAWNDVRPDTIVIEGQGSIMNPAYPGGHEIIAAGRPDLVVLQHAPARKEYDGFPGYPLHPLSLQIEAIELLSGKPVAAITVNHEGLTEGETDEAVAAIRRDTGRPCCAPLRSGLDSILGALLPASQHGV